jgi:magnesium transporter
MIRSLYLPTDGPLRTGLSLDEIKTALKDEDGLLWVDFEATDPVLDEAILKDVFHFHPLAIDDALQETHVPKIDDWGNYLYIVLHAITFERAEQITLETLELDIFLGKNYLVTHHDDPIAALQHVSDITQRDERHIRNGPDYLLYRIADEVVASYMPVVEQLDEAIDQAEDEVFDQPTTGTLELIFDLKRSALHLRRIIGPQREVMNKLARDDYRVIDLKARVYFRDVYDHLVRLYDISESIRDLVGGALDTYLSVINNRMNDIMRTLTVITTLFMPISFVVGFFGMNFFIPTIPLDIWTGAPAFVITLLIIVGTPLLMGFWIRRRGWLG